MIEEKDQISYADRSLSLARLRPQRIVVVFVLSVNSLFVDDVPTVTFSTTPTTRSQNPQVSFFSKRKIMSSVFECSLDSQLESALRSPLG